MRLIIFLFCFLMTLVSCNDDNLFKDQRLDNIEKLEQSTMLDDITLPEGSLVTKVNNSEIEIELPEEYAFLMVDLSGEVVLSNFGGYTCTCSGKNSCTVFYNEAVGYGCLQSDCTGSCTGKKSGGGGNQAKILGVIKTSQNEIITATEKSTASLTVEGYDYFFEKIAAEKIKEQYDFIYQPLGVSNTQELLEQYSEQELGHIVVQYLGVTFSLLVPNTSINNNDGAIVQLRSGSGVTCTGSGNCTCKQSKKCVLGNCVYYCNGCTSCTLEVPEN